MDVYLCIGVGHIRIGFREIIDGNGNTANP